jgi:hypothetical protein
MRRAWVLDVFSIAYTSERYPYSFNMYLCGVNYYNSYLYSTRTRVCAPGACNCKLSWLSIQQSKPRA